VATSHRKDDFPWDFCKGVTLTIMDCAHGRSCGSSLSSHGARYYEREAGAVTEITKRAQFTDARVLQKVEE
jgi:hypothetical protein